MFVILKLLTFVIICQVTAQQSYCVSIARPSLTSSFVRNCQADWHKILWNGNVTYPRHISGRFFFKVVTFFYFFFRFFFSWDHMKGKSFKHLIWNYRFIPQNSCILIGRVSTKVAKRIMKNQILGCWQFFFFPFFVFVMNLIRTVWELNFQTTSETESTHQTRCLAPPNSCILLGMISTSELRYLQFWRFGIFFCF